MKEIQQELECTLNEAELNERGQRMSSAMLKYDEVEAAKKEAVKDYSEEMKALRGQMRELPRVIRRRSEIRTVTCGVQFHMPEVGMKRVIRLDTGEIVRDEVMTVDERQNNLFEDIQELNRMFGSGDTDNDLPKTDGAEQE
jgi:hypothetical protein